ncbi:MAG: alpha amylase family protein [Capsulimonadaceae bacterium]|nr:alpha amylase family protein [Capsulimonadaceae bacterium]
MKLPAAILTLLIASAVPVAAQNSFPPPKPGAATMPPAGLIMPPPLVIAPPAPAGAQASLPAQMPFPDLPSVPLDSDRDAQGIAQETARTRGAQGRILWVDATANLERCNSAQDIHDLVVQAKNTGFNVIVVDVKPVIGYTTYPSKIAPKLADWKGARLPGDFDPLAVFVREGHAAGLQVCANLAVFSEGHKYFGKGPGYDDPSLQTVLYEATRSVKAPVPFSPSLTIADIPNALPADPDAVAVYTDAAALKRSLPGALVTITDQTGKIMAQVDGAVLPSVSLYVPSQGAILVAQGKSADSLRATTRIGDYLAFATAPRFVPIAGDSNQKVALFVNPNDPAVQQRELDLVQEVVANYAVDGVVFDDRLRFAGINADFSLVSMQQFEQYVGRPIKWPDDIFHYNAFPNQDIVKGPYYQAWRVWRALTIRNWLAKARAIVKFYRPHATLSVYAGSWYGEYGDLGENWAAVDYAGAFDFNSPDWRQTGFASLLDWITTGCYYPTATISEGAASGSVGATVEAAGQLSNKAVDDQTWVYAGIYLEQFSNKNDNFAKALQAAAASTQGVMIFDVSQVTDSKLWPVLAQAFSKPAQAPHEIAGLIDTVRARHASASAPSSSGAEPAGKAGTGL